MPDGVPKGAVKSFDAVGHVQASRQQARSPRLFASLIVAALRLVRRASPRLANVNAALQFAGAVLLLLQVVFGKLALTAILDEAGDGGGSFGAVVPSLAGLVVVTGLGGLALAAQRQLQVLLAETVQREMLGSVLEVSASVSLETFESPAFHDDLERVKTNAGLQPLNLSQALVSIAGGLLGVIALVVALAAIEPLLLPVLLLSAAPQALLSRRSGQLEFQFRVRETPSVRLRQYLLEALTGRDEAKEVRAFDLGGVLARRWNADYDGFLARLRGHVRRRVRLAVVTSLFTFVAAGATLGLLVWFAVDGRVGLASAGAALIAIRLLAGRMDVLVLGIGQLFECSLFLADHERFMARGAEAESAGADDGEAVAPFEELRLEDIRFRYPETERDVLRGVSMEVRAGEVVALVGENGSGKTTLAKLLGHVLTPTAGRIAWDGTDSAELPPVAVRRNIGVIFQDFVRYQLSARENIGFGRPEAVDDLDSVVAAARRGGADPFLRELPDGYETMLGKSFFGGYDLSLGQWQRVALARAFFRDASFLILDEPTASLDAPSERALFEQMRELADGRSVLLISHRFATVRSADRILVLHDGELVEQGSHDELMAQGGRYAEMFTMQAESYR